jgi:hypothetical protein
LKKNLGASEKTKGALMTPIEHEALSARMRILAQGSLLDWLVDLLGSKYAELPVAERSRVLMAMKAKLDETRQEYSTMTLPNLSAAESDLQTAEFQEAFDSLSKNLIERMSKKLS